MDACRICETVRKKMRSVFDSPINSRSRSYADIITSIANVKVTEGSGSPTNLCRLCCRKLEETYDFKLQIERVAAKYNNNGKLKINFNNISEIKLEIDFVKLEKDYESDQSNIKFDFEGKDCYDYHGTTIKKVACNDYETEDPKSVTITEFLNTYKVDDDEFQDAEGALMDDHGHSSNDENADEEYKPNRNISLKINKVKKSSKKFKSDADKSKLRIKPVFIPYLKLIPSKPAYRPRNSENRPRLKKETVCPYCGKLVKQNTIEKHILQHTESRHFKCDQCSRSFYRKKDLQRHIRRHEAGLIYKCDLCVAAFKEKGSLTSHMKVHSDEKSFICEICSKSFKRRHAHRRHVKCHNSANKSIKCELCNMTFFFKSSLKHHMRIHTGERPFKCEICSQPYSYKHDFNRHCWKKHGIFLKRRHVYVMNEEVLERERRVMKDLLRRINGELNEGEALNPFEGPQAAQAFQMAIKTLKMTQIPTVH